MKKIVYSIAFLLVFASIGTAQKAEAILEKSAAAYDKANGISARFAVNIRTGNGGGSESFEAEISMLGDKFRLITPDMRVWFDGTTQWTYMARTNEVNITAPSGDELLTVNPIMFLRRYKKNFKASHIGESTSDLGKMADDIRLTARNAGNDIKEVNLQIDRATSLPVRITFTLAHDVATSVRIGKMQTGANPPAQTFVFNEADYPDVEVVDLR
ncbi:MAG: hypothetical protein LBR50_07065 [Tannerella sp.]|nr:hypothetical protein [Tannerella sp.]